MRILGIETATSVCGVAIVEADSASEPNVKCLGQYELNIKNIHSEKLVSMIQRVLCDTHTTTTTLDGVAVSIGPGSFTGLRIGLSAAKGLVYAVDKPLMAVPTLDAMAHRFGLLSQTDTTITICPMLDARRDEVYYAFYRWQGSKLDRITECRVGTIADVTHQLSHETIVVGDGAAKVKKLALECIFPEVEPLSCSSTAVALLGLEKLKSGDVVDVHTLEPFYLKSFVTSPAGAYSRNNQGTRN